MGAETGGHYPSWEFLECDGEVPQSRSGHTCALHKNRYLYIFGGFDGSNCFEDLYALDIDTGRWRRVEAGGSRPSGRASHSAVTDDLAGVMYIFGGSGSHFGYTNKRDLCEFCFETECWRLLSNPLEDTPSARYGQSMVAYQEGLYVWGGTHGTNYPTDMHRFDLCSKQWEYVDTTGDLPCGRYRHQAMVHEDLMYIVGGSGINRYGDVFTFHFETSIWRKLVCTGTDLSDGRYAHSAVLRNGYIYLYGGNDGVRHDDLQQLDLATRVWSRVVVHGTCPPGRDFHAAVLRKDSMVIFGGSNGMRRHNDVFEFHMAPKIPRCTLSADLEALLEQAQMEGAEQLSCDLFLAAQGECARGVFCHSHMLLVRCPRLYQHVKGALPAELRQQHPRRVDHASTEPAAVPAGQVQGPSDSDDQTTAPLPGAPAKDQDDTIDSLLRAVTDSGWMPSPPLAEIASGVAEDSGAAAPQQVWTGHSDGRCPSIAVSLPYTTLWHLVHFLYSETVKFGRLSAEELYCLFLATKQYEVLRLAALCERQIKLRLGLDNVLPLLRVSTQEGAIAQPIQDACKHFFLANYNNCTELRECEGLDPKLLCELMRLHNSRAASAANAAAASLESLRGTGGSPNQSQALSPPFGAHAAGGGRLCAAEEGMANPATHRGLSLGTVTIPPETLARDVQRLLPEAIAPDFEVVVQDEVIRAHKFILVARSRYFASCILTSGMVEAQAGRLIIPPTSAMTAEAFRAFLRFLYAGDDILEILAPQIAMYLIDTSSFYGLTNLRLKHFCELCVRNSFNEEHVLQLFAASSRLNVEAVRAMALEFIVANFRSVCKKAALEQLDRNLLVEILRGIADRLPPTASEADMTGGPQSLG